MLFYIPPPVPAIIQVQSRTEIRAPDGRLLHYEQRLSNGTIEVRKPDTKLLERIVPEGNSYAVRKPDGTLVKRINPR